MFVSKKNVMTSHIAMWSGPRTISTAMMRAWESRGDCVVTDEPLYAHYLDHTQIQHPGFEEVVRSQSTSWQEVTQSLCGPIPGQQPFWYQKHMTHHLLDHIDRAWMSHLRHCFLIRHPREVLASYARRRESVTVEDLGFQQQAEIFQFVRDELGQIPLVVDSRELLQQPSVVLRKLCSALGIPFMESMLHWESGLRATDGVWAKHWYDSVVQTTGFEPYRERLFEYPDEYEPFVQEAMPYYQTLFTERVLSDDSSVQ